MGKASRWFRGLLGLKNVRRPNQKPPPRNKWSSVKAHKDENRQKSRNDVVPGREHDDDASKHATALAAVVQLTSSGRNISLAGRGGNVNTPTARVTLSRVGNQSREEWAAVMIQSHFRAYLSRRALRALKALVKLQALARGYLVRRQTAHALRRLQALVRAQVRARAGRLLVSESPQSSMKTSQFNYPGPVTPEKFEHVLPARSMKQDQLMTLKRNGSKSGGSVRYDPVTRVNCIWMDSRQGERLWEQGSFTRSLPTNGGQSDEILEVDSGKPRASSRRRSLFYSSHLCQGSDQNCQSFSTSKDSTARQSVLSPSSGEVQSFSPLGIAQDDDESAFCTADNSPAFYSASSGGGSLKRVTFTPIKSDGSHSCLSGYSDCPNYMANTKSSKAKVRSLSAPKQRPQFERSNSSKRYSVHANFTNKAYPGSGRLDRLGLPIRGDVAGFSGGHWHRH